VRSVDGSARPLLKPWYRLAAGAERVTLRFGESLLELEGRAASTLLPELLPRLDGTRTVDEIVAALGMPIRPAIEHALALLAAHGLLTEAPAPGLHDGCRRSAELLSATDPHRRSPRELAQRLGEARVAIVGAAQTAEEVARLLQLAGVAVVARAAWAEPLPEATELALAAPRGDELALLDAWNEGMLHAGVPWLQLLPFDGALAAVGPLFLPGETACHRCYRLRRAAHLPRGGDPLGPGRYPSAPALDAVQAGLGATVALRRLTGGGGLDAGVLLALEAAPELTLTRHVVYRVPRCPACSPAQAQAVLSPWHEESAVAA
jgi:bacteriocin biosynthesis cyclodehydratase domain-containing protein